MNGKGLSRREEESRHLRNRLFKSLLVVLGLGQKEGGVETLLSHQVIMRSLLDDLASVDDKDPVGHFYGRQPVAD